VSLIEIYNETIQDLLSKDAKTLDLKTAGNKINIPGLTEVEIKNLDDIKKANRILGFYLYIVLIIN
jgi:transcription antitermination factor NusG